MYLISAFFLIAVAGFGYSRSRDGIFVPSSNFAGMVAALGFVVSLVIIPIYRAQAYDQLAQRDALEATYNQLRSNQNPLEMATVGRDVAKWNAWLASAQYWHNTQWSPYWPEAVMYAKPIR